MDLTSKCTCRKNFIDLWYTVFFKIQSQIFSKILHFWSKDLLFFYQDRVYFDTGFQNFFPISIFTKVQNFTMVQWLRNSNLLLEVMKLWVRNIAFLDILGDLVSLWPSTLGQWPQILHTSCQAPGASFCKIFIHKSKAVEVF